MSSRRSADRDGRVVAARLRLRIGEELRLARRSNGLSQRAIAAAAGLSSAQVSRIERGAIVGLSFDQAARAGEAVGLRLTTGLFPSGDAVRDAGQLRLLERFRSLLPASIGWRTEVGLPIPGDRRAWDVVIADGRRRVGCEAEMRLLDVQALTRRLTLKLRDGDVDALILVVADTRNNRAVLAAHREALRDLLPLDGRLILGPLRDGRLPRQNGLVVL